MNCNLFLYLIMPQEIFEEYINQISLLTPSGVELLYRLAKPKKLKKGDILLKKGQVCDAYYLVEAGFLCTIYYSGDLPSHSNLTFEGSFTCDLQSMKEQMPSLLSIEAGEDVLVWLFDSKMLFESGLLAAEIMHFSRRMISRLQIESAEYENLLKLNKPAMRYEYIENNNPELMDRISFSQMAFYLGVTKDTLKRIKKKKQ